MLWKKMLRCVSKYGNNSLTKTLEFGAQYVSTVKNLTVISVTRTVTDGTCSFHWFGERGFH